MGILTPVAVKIGSIAWMPRLLPQIVAVDRTLQRVTGRLRGRPFGLLDLAGLPSVTLRVVGRRTGIMRSTQLLAVPFETGWLIAGSYFGGPDMPKWVFNVRSATTAEVVVDGRTYSVIPYELDGDRRSHAWARMVEVWPNFDLYEARTERRIPVFFLEPAEK